MSDFTITTDLVNRLLTTVDAGLVAGVGDPVPGQMCVEAAVCYAMGLPHGDEPTCVAPTIRELKISLNDISWSSSMARAQGMRRLAVLQLGTRNMRRLPVFQLGTRYNFDDIEFAKRVFTMTVRDMMPQALTEAKCFELAAVFAGVTTYDAARKAIEGTVSNSRYIYEPYQFLANLWDAEDDDIYGCVAMVRDCVITIQETLKDDNNDNVLLKFAKNVEDILIDMKVPAIEFLPLLD